MRALLSLLPLLGACALYPRSAREDEQYIPVADCLWGECEAPAAPAGGEGSLLGLWEGTIDGESQDYDVVLDLTADDEAGLHGEITLTDDAGNDGSGSVEETPEEEALVLSFTLTGSLHGAGHLTLPSVSPQELSGTGFFVARSGPITLTPVE